MKKQLQKVAQKTFQKLKFVEDTHTYTVDGKKIPSTSSLIKQFYEQFDAQRVSFSMSKGDVVKQQKLLSQWENKRDSAAIRGTDIHNFAENYVKQGFKYTARSFQTNTIQKQAVINFWNNLPDYYIPIFTELQMYHPVYGYAGTSDFELGDTRDNSLVIGDYKTNENLFKSYGKTMLRPFTMLDDTPYNHYQIQFSYYQILLEQLGYKVSARMLVWLKHDGTHEVFYTTDYSKVLKKHFEYDKWRNNTESSEHLF